MDNDQFLVMLRSNCALFNLLPLIFGQQPPLLPRFVFDYKDPVEEAAEILFGSVNKLMPAMKDTEKKIQKELDCNLGSGTEDARADGNWDVISDDGSNVGRKLSSKGNKPKTKEVKNIGKQGKSGPDLRKQHVR